MSKGIHIDLKGRYDASVNARQYYAHTVSEKYVLYGGAKGGGKTAWGINEGLRLSLAYAGNRGFMGCRDGTDFKRNALDQVFKFLAPELYSPPLGLHHKTDQYFKLVNGSVMYYGGLGDEAEAERKINNFPELGWVFIDQAEEISELQFLKLDGQVRLNIPGLKHKVLLTANPDPGWLRDRFIAKALPNHRFISALPKDNPFLPEDYEKNLREVYPADMVKRLLEGDWDVMAIDTLIPYDWIRGAIERGMPESSPAVGGLDVAEFGESSTVFIARRGNRVVDIVSWKHMDTEFTAGTVAELIRKHKLVTLNIDTIGKGGEVYVLLKHDYPVKAVVVNEKAEKEDRYVNQRAEHYGNLARRFETGEISIPDHAKLASELASLKKKYPKGKLMIESKEDMKKRGFKSPDFADALMLAFISTPVNREVSMYVGGVRVV